MPPILSVFLLILTLILTNINEFRSNLIKNFPCKAPDHNSYPFCNTSLSITTRAQSLTSLLTLQEKIQQLSDNVSSIPRLGIPAFEWWSESLHGIAANGPGINFNGPITKATLFPQVILTAASFNRTLWYSIASSIAIEARAMYNLGQAGLTFWAPNINVFRDPRWGRGQETPGEDPMVVSDYAVEYVKGFQGGDLPRDGGGKRRILKDESDNELMLSACCKHYAAYDLEKWGEFTRYNFNAVVRKQDMEDTYQPPFKSCIQKGKASCLMCSYNSINGIPACAHQELLQKARIEWGFNGYITSDCDAVATIYEYHNYTKTEEDAVSIALKAGTDINCGTYMLRHTKSAIDQGKIVEKDIDRALINLFSVQIRLGLFDGDPTERKFGRLGVKNVCTSKHTELALEAARQGMVLLKNDNKFLPLNKKHVSSLALIGPMANTTSLGGGYSGIPCTQKSILDGFRDYVERIYYEEGCVNVACNTSEGFEQAIIVTREAEYTIVVAGIDLTQETEDLDRYSLLLPGYQMSLVSNIAYESKKPIILVLTGGGPMDVSFAKMDPRIASIIWIGYPGEAGGKALSEIIFGDYNPGGRLPMTWYPESYTSIPMNDMSMRADPSREYPGRTYRFYTGESVYKFGHGKSYTSFTYKITSAPEKISLLGSGKIDNELSNVNVDEIGNCDSLRFYMEICVMNNGDMDGGTVLLLFTKVPGFIEGAPVKQLIGYDRVHTHANETSSTSILVDPCQHFSFVNEYGIRVVPFGDHVLMVEELEHIVSVEP